MRMKSTANLSMLSDEQLYHLLAQENELALSILFDRHWDRLFKVAYHITQDHATASDIVQDVILQLWERRNEVEIQNLSHYLSRAVKLHTFRVLRDSKAQAHHLETLQQVEMTNCTEESIHFNDLSIQVEKTVESLPDKCKKVFELSRQDGFSQKEIAAELEISEKTVANHLTKALSYLRLSLKEASV